MAFIPVKRESGASIPIKILKGTDAESFTLGQGVYESAGYATNAGANVTVSPQYVTVAAVAASTVAGSTNPDVPVIKVSDDIEFRVVSNATVSATSVGSIMTISTSGLQCTATASTGTGGFRVTYTDGSTTATYSNVRGYFQDYTTY